MMFTILKVITSLMFFVLAADKFLHFLKPPCSLEETFSQNVWMMIGYVYIAAASLLWHKKIGKRVAIIFAVVMIAFSIWHLVNDTYDIGGALFMALLLGLIAWKPEFLTRQKQTNT